MPLNSVQQYVKGLLDGLVVEDGIPALEAYVQPPVLEDLNGPRAYVWGNRLSGKRQTMPRINYQTVDQSTAGYKWLDWTVDVYLSYLTNPDDVNVDQEFPLIVDAVMWKLWTTEMPIVIQDPTTSLYSQILAIGEEWELEYPPERAPSTMRMLYYTCRLGLRVYEAVQA